LASTDPTVPTVTVHCELGNCGRCRGTVFSITDAHGRPCQHPCHAADEDPAARCSAGQLEEVA
jgi:hypothetical protein